MTDEWQWGVSELEGQKQEKLDKGGDRGVAALKQVKVVGVVDIYR